MLVLFSLSIFVFVLPIMDQLPSDQQTQICKASSDRVRQGLLSAGAEENVVAGMDRASLKEAAAKQKLQLPSDADRELNMKKHEFEMRKFERDAELELARIGREEKEKEREEKEERAEREKERELEEKKRKLEHEFRMKDLEMRGAAPPRGESGTTGGRTAERGDGPRWEETLAGRTKRYGETLRHVLPKIPTADNPTFVRPSENAHR